MPFLDRRLERKVWRRPIPALAVATVVLGMISLGMKSEMDDQRAPVAQQLTQQQQEEKAFSAAPFEPYTITTATVPAVVKLRSTDPLVPKGKAIFTERGCSACHGDNGSRTPLAPSLIGVTAKFPKDRLAALLHQPSARMKAGGMPAVDASPDEMAALLVYLAGARTAQRGFNRHPSCSFDGGAARECCPDRVGNRSKPGRTSLKESQAVSYIDAERYSSREQ